MKNLRVLVVVVLSLLAGAMAIMLAARWLNQKTAMSTRKVAVAMTQLELGQVIKPDHIRFIEWPVSAVPEGAFSEPAALVDRVARVKLLRDEPILESKLAPVGSTGGLSAVISEGKRAITVRVNDVVGVAGFALPGNLVDVIVSVRDESRGKGEENISKIVLEKILVLAVAQEASRDATAPKVVNAVTLEVTPGQAEAIDLARNIGQLSLVLRNQIDAGPVATRGMTKAALLGEETPAAPAVHRTAAPAQPAVQSARNCVVAIVGKERKLECF